MPKKPNFLGGQQNYNKSTGEYEPNLVGPNGKVVKDADGDGISHESKKKKTGLGYDPRNREQSTENHNKKISEINDKYGRNKLTKQQYWDAIDLEVDRWNNEQQYWYEKEDAPYDKDVAEYQQKRYREKLQEHDFNDPSERESLKAKEADFNEPNKEEKVKRMEEIIPQLNKEFGVDEKNGFFLHKTDDPAFDGVNLAYPVGQSFTPNELEYALKNGTLKGYEELANARESAMRNADKTKNIDQPFKLDKEKYSDVEETPYGFIYNVNGHSITDVRGQKKAFGEPFEENKDYGFWVEIDGDEVFAKDFDEAYRKAKGGESLQGDIVKDNKYNTSLEPQGYKIFKEFGFDGENPDNDPELEDYWRKFVGEEINENKLRDLLKTKQEKGSVYPKGTSKEYTNKVNKKFEEAKPILERLGIKLEDFGGKPSGKGGFEDNTKEIMDKYVFDPFRKKYPKGNNEVWEKEYQPIFDAIESVADKNYNDWYIKNKR